MNENILNINKKIQHYAKNNNYNEYLFLMQN